MEIGLTVRLKAYLGLESLCEREINQKLRTKINQKFIGVHRTAHLGLESPDGEKSYRIDSKSNRILGLYAGRHTNISARCAWKLLNFILLFLAMAMLKQA